jgi:hypothetical protein
MSCFWKVQECYYSGSPTRIRDSSLHATGVNAKLSNRVGLPSPGTSNTTASQSSGVVSTIRSDSKLSIFASHPSSVLICTFSNSAVTGSVKTLPSASSVSCRRKVGGAISALKVYVSLSGRLKLFA